MPKCPKCDKEIESLLNIQSGTNIYNCYLSGGHLEYDLKDNEADGQVSYWACPECDKELFWSETDAEEFLKVI